MVHKAKLLSLGAETLQINGYLCLGNYQWTAMLVMYCSSNAQIPLSCYQLHSRRSLLIWLLLNLSDRHSTIVRQETASWSQRPNVLADAVYRLSMCRENARDFATESRPPGSQTAVQNLPQWAPQVFSACLDICRMSFPTEGVSVTIGRSLLRLEVSAAVCRCSFHYPR